MLLLTRQIADTETTGDNTTVTVCDAHAVISEPAPVLLVHNIYLRCLRRGMRAFVEQGYRHFARYQLWLSRNRTSVPGDGNLLASQNCDCLARRVGGQQLPWR